MSDLISRQAAIDALDKRFDSIPMEQTTEILLLRKDLRNLPAVQPERKRGKWIYGEHDVAMCDGYRCDKCDFFVPWDYQHKSIDFIKDYNYCPSCGVDMEVKMTSQVAITLLKSLEQSLDSYCELNDEGKTAFSMAISALELFGNSEQLPSVQPEGIRCKDCKHWMMGKTTKNYPNPYICELHSFMHGFERSALPEDYCSWAELRGDSDEN